MEASFPYTLSSLLFLIFLAPVFLNLFFFSLIYFVFLVIILLNFFYPLIIPSSPSSTSFCSFFLLPFRHFPSCFSSFSASSSSLLFCTLPDPICSLFLLFFILSSLPCSHLPMLLLSFFSLFLLLVHIVLCLSFSYLHISSLAFEFPLLFFFFSMIFFFQAGFHFSLSHYFFLGGYCLRFFFTTSFTLLLFYSLRVSVHCFHLLILFFVFLFFLFVTPLSPGS